MSMEEPACRRVLEGSSSLGSGGSGNVGLRLHRGPPWLVGGRLRSEVLAPPQPLQRRHHRCVRCCGIGAARKARRQVGQGRAWVGENAGEEARLWRPMGRSLKVRLGVDTRRLVSHSLHRCSPYPRRCTGQGGVVAHPRLHPLRQHPSDHRFTLHPHLSRVSRDGGHLLPAHGCKPTRGSDHARVERDSCGLAQGIDQHRAGIPCIAGCDVGLGTSVARRRRRE
mmetsp:Transcript_106638/g.308534  ORF Transcript_106638/g.308534 Transcript_106638/m.308534 type:complete len:224 (+) Transcript_106638:1389-2060(+)